MIKCALFINISGLTQCACWVSVLDFFSLIKYLIDLFRCGYIGPFFIINYYFLYVNKYIKGNHWLAFAMILESAMNLYGRD